MALQKPHLLEIAFIEWTIIHFTTSSLQRPEFHRFFWRPCLYNHNWRDRFLVARSQSSEGMPGRLRGDWQSLCRACRKRPGWANPSSGRVGWRKHKGRLACSRCPSRLRGPPDNICGLWQSTLKILWTDWGTEIHTCACCSSTGVKSRANRAS